MIEAFLVGYLYTIIACDGGTCKKVVEMMLPNEGSCAEWDDKLAAHLPESPPAFWGFPNAKGSVQVRQTCERVKGLSTRL